MRRSATRLVLAAVAVVLVVPSAPVDAAPDPVATRPVAAGAAKRLPRAVFFGDSYFVGGGCSPDPTRDMAQLAGLALGYRPVIRGAGGTGFVMANPDYGLLPYL